MCLSAAEVYSVKVIQRERSSLQEDYVDKSHCLQSVVTLWKQEKMLLLYGIQLNV